MKYLEAPNHLDFLPYPAVFLAGGITGCPDWQSKMVALLKDIPDGVLMNPRRKNFDVTQKDVSREQITWEFNHLWKSDIIVFWFSKDTIQPIVLLELGSRLAQVYLNKDGYVLRPELLIGIEPGYSREEDVIIQSELALGQKINISRSLEDLAVRVKKLLIS